jgi:hypothetical protein
MTDRLESRADFENLQTAAQQQWNEMWQGNRLIVSVGVDSSSDAKGAREVLAACRAALAGTNAIVREVSGNGAMWMEPIVEVKRPGEPPIVYGWIAPEDVPALLSGGLQDRAVGVRSPDAFGEIPPLAEHPFFRHQHRIVMEDFGVIEPESIEDALARGAYSGLIKVLFEMTAEEAIAEVTAAGLRGRGGAGFPAGIKWESGRKARARPKFVAVNSHEANRTSTRTGGFTKGTPTKSSKACSSRASLAAPNGHTTTSAASIRWPSSASEKRSRTRSGWG